MSQVHRPFAHVAGAKEKYAILLGWAGAVVDGLTLRDLRRSVALSLLLVLAGLLRWEHCRDSARLSTLGHRSNLAIDGHSSGGPAPPTAAVLVDVPARGGTCPPARRQFSAS